MLWTKLVHKWLESQGINFVLSSVVIVTEQDTQVMLERHKV